MSNIARQGDFAKERTLQENHKGARYDDATALLPLRTELEQGNNCSLLKFYDCWLILLVPGTHMPLQLQAKEHNRQLAQPLARGNLTCLYMLLLLLRHHLQLYLTQ
jgi:hypothetical protein